MGRRSYDGTRAHAPIESADSDGDGFTNIAEINAKTFPGDAASKPATPPPTATSHSLIQHGDRASPITPRPGRSLPVFLADVRGEHL
jgi:hypothetical protein